MFTLIKYSSYPRLLLALSLVTACSGLTTYQNTLEKNLHVTTKTDSSVSAAVDIYRVNPDCSIKYSGTIKLDDPIFDIGIATGRSSYLVFVFTSSGFFSGSGSTTYNTLLRPKTGARYNIDVSYTDDIYNVVIHEKQGTNKSREVETKSLSACRPLEAQ